MAKKKAIVLSPNIKFKKTAKSLSNVAYHHLNFSNTIMFNGVGAIQAGKDGLLTRQQLEATRVALRRPIKAIKGSKVVVCFKPSIVITKRSQETRMGKGKGGVFSIVSKINVGQLLFRVIAPNILPGKLMSILNKAKRKLPVPCVSTLIK